MASPHIAGLLAYMLSLQPAKDSAYAVADITPKKLKSHIISIGTTDALAGIPSDTENILAWNGGGNSNYSDIIGKGSYAAKRTGEESEFSILPQPESVEKMLENAGETVRLDSEKMAEKVNRITDEIEDFVKDEIKGFLKDFEGMH